MHWKVECVSSETWNVADCSPDGIVTQRRLDHNKHCKCAFGECVIAAHQNAPVNMMIERGIDAICLRPSPNHHGGHDLMNLNAGEVFS